LETGIGRCGPQFTAIVGVTSWGLMVHLGMLGAVSKDSARFGPRIGPMEERRVLASNPRAA
jgi:hypothetical protein